MDPLKKYLKKIWNNFHIWEFWCITFNTSGVYGHFLFSKIYLFILSKFTINSCTVINFKVQYAICQHLLMTLPFSDQSEGEGGKESRSGAHSGGGGERGSEVFSGEHSQRDADALLLILLHVSSADSWGGLPHYGLREWRDIQVQATGVSSWDIMLIFTTGFPLRSWLKINQSINQSAKYKPLCLCLQVASGWWLNCSEVERQTGQEDQGMIHIKMNINSSNFKSKTHWCRLVSVSVTLNVTQLVAVQQWFDWFGYKISTNCYVWYVSVDT